jgi:hypothetical protein
MLSSLALFAINNRQVPSAAMPLAPLPSAMGRRMVLGGAARRRALIARLAL